MHVNGNRIVSIVTLALTALAAALAAACGGSAAAPADWDLYKKKNPVAQVWDADVKRGFEAYARRDAVAARKALEAAYRSKGGADPLIRFRLAQAWDKTGDSARALAWLRTDARTIAAEYPALAKAAWTALGHLQYKADKFKAALDAYEEAYKLGAPGQELHFGMGLAALRLKQHGLAATYLEQADPKDARVNFFLASAYYELKRVDDAIKRMELAVTIEPGNSKALGSLGHFWYAKAEKLEEAGKRAEAKPCVEQAIACYRRAVAAGGALYREYLKTMQSKLRELTLRSAPSTATNAAP